MSLITFSVSLGVHVLAAGADQSLGERVRSHQPQSDGVSLLEAGFQSVIGAVTDLRGHGTEPAVLRERTQRLRKAEVLREARRTAA